MVLRAVKRLGTGDSLILILMLWATVQGDAAPRIVPLREEDLVGVVP